MNSSGPVRRIPSRFIVVGALALMAVVGIALFQSSRPLPIRDSSVAPEFLRAELELRDGRLYHRSETNAFTGWMLERYAGGALQSRSAISNGLLHGLSEGWQTNGQIQIREHFQSGVSHGERIKYYPDGSRMSEATAVEGRLEGTFRRWHPNGQLAESAELRAGVPHGNSTSYFPGGFLKTRAKLQNGEVIETQSWGDGEFHVSTTGSPPR